MLLAGGGADVEPGFSDIKVHKCVCSWVMGLISWVHYIALVSGLNLKMRQHIALHSHLSQQEQYISVSHLKTWASWADSGPSLPTSLRSYCCGWWHELVVTSAALGCHNTDSAGLIWTQYSALPAMANTNAWPCIHMDAFSDWSSITKHTPITQKCGF